jgi:exonuclease VII large subunit
MRYRKTLERIDKNREKVRELKREIGCQVCGETDHRVLQFHHTDPTLKEMSVSKLLQKGYSFSRIEKEIKKCEIVCANCHIRIHH